MIQGGRIIDPASSIDGYHDLYLADGRIVALGTPPESFTVEEVFDVKGNIVCPGLIDLCARFREPGFEHKASIASEAKAAVVSGITTICCPPDTYPVIDSPAVVKLIQEKALLTGKIRILPVAALTQCLDGETLSEMSALKRAGCLAVSNAYAPMANTRVLRRALEYAASYDLLVVVRPEDPYLVDNGCVHEGMVSTRLGLPGIPYAAETVAIAQVLALVEHTGARVHFGQLSCARSIGAISRAQERGTPVSADVAVHQLHLTETSIEGFNPYCHVRPPFRSIVDRENLQNAVRDGVIAAICSDHQPHEPDAKQNAFPDTAPGISSIPLLLPLVLDLVEKGDFTVSRAIAALTSHPAHILGLDIGTLRPGAPADICVFDPEASWIVNDSTWCSAGRNTPFWNQTMRGQVTHTFFSGELVYKRTSP